MPYVGPKRIVITGGGLAGLACADAVTSALANAPGVPGDVEVIVLEDGGAGGNGAQLAADDPAFRALHPAAPRRAPRSRGVRFFTSDDKETRALFESVGVSYSASSSSCFAWLAPPDVAGGLHASSRAVKLTSLHLEQEPEPVDERVRAVVELVHHGGPVAQWLGTFLTRTLGFGKDLEALLPSLPTLLQSAELSACFRWGAALLVDLAHSAPSPDDSRPLRALLDGRAPSDVDAQELVAAVVERRLLPGFVAARKALQAEAGGDMDVVVAEMRALAPDDVEESLAGALPLVELLAADATDAPATFDVEASALFQLYLGGGRPWPFGLDGATALAWLRRRRGAPAGARALVVDGADLDEALRALKDRLQGRFGSEVNGRFLADTWTSRVLLFGDGVSGVEVTDNVDRMAELVPTVRAARRGIATGTVEADLVVSAHKPQVLASLLVDDENRGARQVRTVMKALARDTEEPLTLRLFFPQKLALFPRSDAFDALPHNGDSDEHNASRGSPPSALHLTTGPFHTVIDLERALGERVLESVALGGKDGEKRLYGTALELQGTWASAFWSHRSDHDPRAPWPPAVRELLRRLAEDPTEYEPSTIDVRLPLRGDGGLPAPMLGEVKGLDRTRYLERWIEEASLVVVSAALAQLSELPGLDEGACAMLVEEAERVAEARHPRVRFMLWRGCQAEDREVTFAPGVWDRPVAGASPHVTGLLLAGAAVVPDVGSVGIAAEVRSGLAAARAVLEAMSAGGLEGLNRA